ncbi:MAG: HAD hydrolase-like protein [Clostridiales bacterium]|nr:HAD hydrolase-like protein [Clostridiales bacterium]
MEKCILFDLDGTLTESGEGIIKSVQYALEKMGKPETDTAKLRVFIGPPLIEQFMEYSGMSRNEAEKALLYYRERYEAIGIFENRPYPGIEDMLKILKEKGYILSVASSKPEFYVIKILEHFHIRNYFDEVVGATMDEKRTDKAAVIAEAWNRLKLSQNRKSVFMVGDKEHDIIGARKNRVPCIAVSYGYGTMQELLQEKPFRMVHSVHELQEVLLSL